MAKPAFSGGLDIILLLELRCPISREMEPVYDNATVIKFIKKIVFFVLEIAKDKQQYLFCWSVFYKLERKNRLNFF